MFWNLFKFEPKPYAENFLQTKDGHQIYYRQFGNPKGVPVLSFHGGPGGSSRPKYAKLFNKHKYCFIQFDQRGCGCSTAEDIWRNNTTDFLLEDAKHILETLNIKEKIIVHGVSWGSTLALLFAEKYPELVQKIVVSSVFLARAYDTAWVQRESERFYPDLWHQMRLQIKGRDVYDTYHKMMFSHNNSEILQAMTYLGSYEFMLGKLDPQFTTPIEIDEQELTSQRIAFRYDENKYYIQDNQIIVNAEKIKHIPTLIVHNRLDFCCPLKQAWDLHLALPKSRLIIAAGFGHSTKKLLKICQKEIEKEEER